MNRQMMQASARGAAIKELISRHQDEWDKIIGDAREREGLPRYAGQAGLQAELRALRQRVAELENGNAA